MLNNFYIYRLPKDTKTTIATDCDCEEGLLSKGFHIAPFDHNRHKSYTLTGGFLRKVDNLETGNLLPPPPDDHCTQKSTPSNYHKELIRDIIKDLKKLESTQGTRGKIVLARTEIIRINDQLNYLQLYKSLEKNYPHAFVFMFHSHHTGMWVGATPETLLRADDNKLFTMALAGTRPAGSIGTWDIKNIEEQKIVSEYILNTMASMLPDSRMQPLSTKQAGPVEHLQTKIFASLPYNFSLPQLQKLLLRLSPTPALGGYPKAESIKFINTHEDFDREYYGGYCGPIDSAQDFSFFVNLRSAKIYSNAIQLYAGGGITQLSSPEEEWLETERKLTTIKKLIV